MKTVFRFYKTLNLLSIDVAAGAIISALFFARIFNAVILPYGYACLGLTVWIIYTADHLLDARTLQSKASTDRHRFHQKNFKPLLVLLIIAALSDILFSFFIRMQVLHWGLILAGVVLLYFFIQSNLRFMKEPAGAILYTSGVLLPSLTSTENSLSFFSLSLIFQFFITALINLILFSWFDFERDKKDQRSSLITTVGYQSGKILLAGLFIIQAGITLVLFIFSPRPTVIVVLLLMNLMLLMIFIFAPYFSLKERYRYAGDAIFFLPFLYLMGS